MDRLACVDVPALPLQQLLVSKPSWGQGPAAVVDRDKPQGTLLWVNEHARQAGILPGQRYAEALSLSGALRAAEVPLVEIDACVARLTEICRRFTPDVEPLAEEPGVFFLKASGLERLFSSPLAWGQAVAAAVHAVGFVAKVVVGFRRFGAYAIARAIPQPGVRVLASDAEETRLLERVPLSRVGLDPPTREALARLGVRTVKQFLALPGNGIRSRFGADAHRLHRLATGAFDPPLAPAPPPDPLARTHDLDDAESSREALLFLAKRELDPLLRKLASRGEALTELVVTLGQRQQAAQELLVRPAEPTLDAVQIMGLLRLRLEATALVTGVMQLALIAEGAPASAEQLDLFAQKPRRDPRAAARALARVQAMLGVGSVVRPRLTNAHLPEARFEWEPIDKLVPAQPRQVDRRPLVRRLLSKPEPLPPRQAREPDGWLLRGLDHGPVDRFTGPYRLSGGWWRREVARDYYFAELRSGALSWVFYDRERRRWARQGDVA